MSTLSISAAGDLNQVVPDLRVAQISTPASLSSTSVTPSSPISALGGHDLNTETKKPHVLVVGAGISGLRAAAVLQRHGVRVTILEGRPDRIGGRILTSRKKGIARDIGAAWMHETSQNKLVQLVRKLNIEYYYDDGTPLYYTRDGRAGSQFKAKKVADEFADYCEWYYEEYPNAQDRPVKDFVHEFVNQHELITSDERRWAPQATREVELWIGTSIEEASSKHLSYFVTERNLYMKGGYDAIVNWTAASSLRNPDTIRLGEVVKDIEWGDRNQSIVVHSTYREQEVRSYTADAVIVTLPLGVLRRKMINFHPELPSSIAEGFRNFSYGALGKVFVAFEEVFWSKDNDQFIYYPSPLSLDAEVDTTSILSYATVTSNLWIMNGTKELCIQIAEPLTQRIESMTSPKLIYDFFEPLFKVLRTEPYKELPKLVSIETTHWTQDPLAGFGTYSVEKSGDNPGILINALEEHRGLRLQFAGEHCTELGNGCVHGAFETGEISAKNLLEVFEIPYDGKDSRRSFS